MGLLNSKPIQEKQQSSKESKALKEKKVSEEMVITEKTAPNTTEQLPNKIPEIISEALRPYPPRPEEYPPLTKDWKFKLMLPSYIIWTENSDGTVDYEHTQSGKRYWNPYFLHDIRCDQKGRIYYTYHDTKTASFADPFKQAWYDHQKSLGLLAEPFDWDSEYTKDGKWYVVYYSHGGASTPIVEDYS
jgi:hypothetical protein